MKRVMIIGGSGSGKSTLAQCLGTATGLPVIHADRFQFEENWKQVPKEERNAKLEQVAASEHWIIDGNYSDTWPLRTFRADTIIFMDPSRYLRLWRILARTVRYFGTNRPDMPKGCVERFDRDFILWTWEYDARRRPNALELIENVRPDQQSITFKNLGEIEDWLAKLASCDNSLSP